MTTCKSCELIARRDANQAPLWDCIYRARYWDVVHNYETSLPGWLVLVARRHVESIDVLTHDEALELGILLRRVSLALKASTGCLKTYVAQFAEMVGHQHVHFHVIPRMADQPADRRGVHVFAYSGVPPEDRLGETQMNAIARLVRGSLETVST